MVAGELAKVGYTVLPRVFDPESIQHMRDVVLSNLAAMAQTRPNPNSYHLAGFHRHVQLRKLHDDIAGHPDIQAALTSAFGDTAGGAIGLTDITVNRSQQWHTDLLRGKYAHHLSKKRNSQAPPTFECYCQFYGESNLPFCACFFSFLVTPKHPPRLSVIVSFMVSRICHFARVFFLSCLNSVAPG